MKNELENNLNILISFRSIDEVSEECLKYVDILDLKDPDKGAIGSWEIKNLKKIVHKFGNRIKISATLGDEDKVYKILNKLNLFDSLKLDYIKFGIFTNEIEQLTFLLNSIKKRKFKTELVPVIFVENKFLRNFVAENIKEFKKFGYNFLLLDTYSKNIGNVFEICSDDYLKILLNQSLVNNISIGLAGKLNLSNISKLVELQPKIIGFRSAVCVDENRKKKLSVSKLKKLYYSITSAKRPAIHAAGA